MNSSGSNSKRASLAHSVKIYVDEKNGQTEATVDQRLSVPAVLQSLISVCIWRYCDRTVDQEMMQAAQWWKHKFNIWEMMQRSDTYTDKDLNVFN